MLMNSTDPPTGTQYTRLPKDQQRRAQPMEAAESQLHLRLHAYSGHHPPASHPAEHVTEQGALAHPRVAAQDEDATRTRQHVGQEPVKSFTFAATSDQFGHCLFPQMPVSGQL
jgi:nucleoid-associated protein YgaU